jgi:NADP-dependent aldehyde dehydrogenase
VFLPKEHGLDDEPAAAVAEASIGPLLNARIRKGYDETAAVLSSVEGVRTTTDAPGFHASPMLLAVSATDLVAHADELLEECFGPAALIIEYGSGDELAARWTHRPAR